MNPESSSSQQSVGFSMIFLKHGTFEVYLSVFQPEGKKGVGVNSLRWQRYGYGAHGAMTL